MESAPQDVTKLLSEIEKGDQEAASKLFPLVYDELRKTAERYMRYERPGHTLQATALVHEAYIKLVRAPSKHFQDRTHFFAFASRVMRSFLVSYARSRKAQKRAGAHEILPLDHVFNLSAAIISSSTGERDPLDEILRLDTALEKLAEFDPRSVKVVELRFFSGLTVEETAEILGISPTQVKRDWGTAKAWLHAELESTTHGELT